MKKTVLSLLAVFCGVVAIGMTAGFCYAAEPVFNDIGGYWAEEEITAAYEKGIVSGYPDGSFQPDRYVTRAEFAAMLSRAFDLPSDAAARYSDVTADDWYAPYTGMDERFISKSAFENNDPFADGDAFGGNENLHRIDAYAAFVETLFEKTQVAIMLPPPEKLYEDVKAKYSEIDYQTGDSSRMDYPGAKRLFEYTWLTDALGLPNREEPGTFYPHSGMSRAEVVWIIADIQARIDAAD